jgi:hypothetical protein
MIAWTGTTDQALADLEHGRFGEAAVLVYGSTGLAECLIRWRGSDHHPSPEVAEI